MIEQLVDENLDHVVGVRREVEGCADGTAYRPAHATGNKVLNQIVAGIFGDSMGDMLSGYRVFSRRFVKSFPAVSREFEIETELTVHSLALRIPSTTVTVDFRDRAEGSESKLRTYRDGWRILNMILSLTRHERPMYFFGLLAGALRPARRWRSARRCSSSTCRPAWCPHFPSLFVAVVPARDQLPGPDGRPGARRDPQVAARVEPAVLHAPPGRSATPTSATPLAATQARIQSCARRAEAGRQAS